MTDCPANVNGYYAESATEETPVSERPRETGMSTSTPPERPRQNDRVKREVEEILESTERKSGPVRMAPLARPRSRNSWLRLSPSMLMLSSLVLVLIGFVMEDQLAFFVFAALGLFAAGYFWSLTARSRRARGAPVARRQPAPRGGRDVYWRGERVDTMKPRATPPAVVSFKPSFGQRVRRFFGRK